MISIRNKENSAKLGKFIKKIKKVYEESSFGILGKFIWKIRKVH